MSRLDYVIFGASGFTGSCLVAEAVRLSREDKSLRWGIAGRSAGKLDQTIKRVHNETGEDLSSLRVISADALDPESLRAMTAQAKVLVNCTGPFRRFGEPVVKACIDTKTNYVDITAEIQFMQTIQLKYSRAAEEAGVYIVTACGLDCVPTDMGVVFLQQNFKGILNSVESFMTVDIPERYIRPGIALVNYGTYESLLTMMTCREERESLKKKLYPEGMQEPKPKMKARKRYYKEFNRRFIQAPALADEDVVHHTQNFFQKTQNQRPVQFKSYVGIPGLFLTILSYIVLPLGNFFIRFNWSRKMLLKHPKFFTLGLISKDGVKAEIRGSMNFALYLRGEGWDENVRDVGSTPTNKTVTAKISGVDPGYAFTAVATLTAAVTILRERHNMPGEGGVLTTGMAFANTSFINTLHRKNYKFEIIEQ